MQSRRCSRQMLLVTSGFCTSHIAISCSHAEQHPMEPPAAIAAPGLRAALLPLSLLSTASARARSSCRGSGGLPLATCAALGSVSEPPAASAAVFFLPAGAVFAPGAGEVASASGSAGAAAVTCAVLSSSVQQQVVARRMYCLISVHDGVCVWDCV